MGTRFAPVLPALVFAAAAGCARQATDPASAPRAVYREHSSVTAAAASPAQVTQPAKSSDDLLSRMAGDLAARLGVKVSALQVTSIEVVVWNDGALGCPQPGRMYTMAEEPGLRVVFQHGGQAYHYHATDRGAFVYCANPPVPDDGLDRQ